jgi:hypothetical protein
MSALDKQVGGDHYKKFQIQPAEFCYVNNIPYLEATAIKYLCRWRDKGGIADLDKAIHFIELLKEFESRDKPKDKVEEASRMDLPLAGYGWHQGTDGQLYIRKLEGEKNVNSAP